MVDMSVTWLVSNPLISRDLSDSHQLNIPDMSFTEDVLKLLTSKDSNNLQL